MRSRGVSGWALAIVFAAGAALGAWGEYTWGPRLIERHTTEKPVITERLITQTETQIAYVPKEVAVYRDPETSRESLRPLDGKMSFGKPEFIFTVNGKPGRFVKADDERYVFDKNMMQISQSSTIRLEAELPTVDKTKYYAIGPAVTTESFGVMASKETAYMRVIVMLGKKWDEKNGRGYEAGGAWQKKF